MSEARGDAALSRILRAQVQCVSQTTLVIPVTTVSSLGEA
jgi:hypothetical protein